MRLGVCYYPEHWPEPMWQDDARRMVELGLSRVRIGEFAWSRIEPEPGRFEWGWLDRAVETLHGAGLGVILGTPTATPPKWLVDGMPDMLAVDSHGRPRMFGSRRHYCSSHQGYREQSSRILRALAERYGRHPAIVAWQTDNEYGCHDTVLSFSEAAATAFRGWLTKRYGNIAALNEAWGNVFWSMEYRDFAEVDLPNLTVTEANPAHWLAFRRFSSDQVVSFNRLQTDIIRNLSPGRDITHNFMGFFTDFDHHAVGADIDFAGWDSYPLGFLEQFWFSEEEKAAYYRQGHPDIAAFHHDLYRGCSRDGRWAVLEQQPGPVNWARFNAIPLPGMVRLWTLEAMAHGAELVSYFRWRQFPQAQEQMHAGLLRPDSVEASGFREVREAANDMAKLGALSTSKARVALVFDYESEWITTIQPQGRGFSALRLTFEFYTALRKLGLDIDIVSQKADLSGYSLLVVPCQPIVDAQFAAQLETFTGQVVIGPRSGSKTGDFAIPAELPPGALQKHIPLKVTRVGSLRNGVAISGNGIGITQWVEEIESAIEPAFVADDGQGLVWRQGKWRYMAGWPDAGLIEWVIRDAARDCGLTLVDLPEGVRTRRAGGLRFAFNYTAQSSELPWTGGYVIGERQLPPGGVAVLRES
jgi:beta-galactosidase